MTSNRPFTFDTVVEQLAGKDPEAKWVPRPNTSVYLMTPSRAVLFLYGSRIATLYADGDVRLEASTDMSNVVRNRLNDVLAPLGWRLSRREDRWYVARTKSGERPDYLEYITNMIVHNVNKKEA